MPKVKKDEKPKSVGRPKGVEGKEKDEKKEDRPTTSTFTKF